MYVVHVDIHKLKSVVAEQKGTRFPSGFLPETCYIFLTDKRIFIRSKTNTAIVSILVFIGNLTH